MEHRRCISPRRGDISFECYQERLPERNRRNQYNTLFWRYKHVAILRYNSSHETRISTWTSLFPFISLIKNRYAYVLTAVLPHYPRPKYLIFTINISAALKASRFESPFMAGRIRNGSSAPTFRQEKSVNTLFSNRRARRSVAAELPARARDARTSID